MHNDEYEIRQLPLSVRFVRQQVETFLQHNGLRLDSMDYYAAVQSVQDAFGKDIRWQQEKDLVTGYEAYFLIQRPMLDSKRVACEIEDSHPLGRLFDIDVIDLQVEPVPRSVIGKEGRKCLLCEHEARYCMRNHTHSREELQQRIEQMIDAYAQ